MEWAKHIPCRDETELASFYFNAGRILAVLHLLGCTDCHHENLIASGDQLILIDTETLLDAEVRDMVRDEDSISPETSLRREVNSSVLRTGLLPHWIIAGPRRNDSYDISALGMRVPPPTSQLPGWIDINNDGMRPGLTAQTNKLPTSLPIGFGNRHPLNDHVEDLISGFGSQMHDVIVNRNGLLSALDRFDGLKRRLVARPTRLYFLIQRQMLQPSNLRLAVTHGLRIEQLSRAFLTANTKPQNWDIFKSELLQMEQLDIPYFEHLIDGKQLELSHGLGNVSGMIIKTGVSAARKRLNGVSIAEIEMQKRLIQGAVSARHVKQIGLTQPPTERDYSHLETVVSTDELVRTESFLNEAFALGQEVWDSSLAEENNIPQWLGIDLTADGQSFNFGLVGPSLYSGKLGLAVLFAGLSLQSTDRDRVIWKERAIAALNSSMHEIDSVQKESSYLYVRDNPLGLNGIGGVLLALILIQHSGVVETDKQIELILNSLSIVRIQSDVNADIINGFAGLIGPLLLHGTPRSIELAVSCGVRLLSLQLDCGGWSCVSFPSSRQKNPLTGFSHGAAGIGAALARLAQVTGDSHFTSSALRGAAYERSVFVPSKDNWPDYRISNGNCEFMLSWCAGAPGIMLSRLIYDRTGVNNDEIMKDLDLAKNATLAAIHNIATAAQDIGVNLCCGAFGITTLMRLYSSVKCCELDSLVMQAEHSIIRQKQLTGNYNFFDFKSDTLDLPGLFTGKAGTALSLLQAYNCRGWLPALLSAGLLIDQNDGSKL